MHQDTAGVCYQQPQCDNGKYYNDVTHNCECHADMTEDTTGVCVTITTDLENGCIAGSGKYWHSHEQHCICQMHMKTDPTTGSCVADSD